MDYATIEEAVRAKLVETFNGLSDTRCKVGDLDSVFQNMLSEGELQGCILDFLRGYPDTQQPFKTQIWIWRIMGIFLIQYSPTIETDMRDVVSSLSSMFAADHTLGGLTARVMISEIDTPEPASIQDVSFYWIPFTVDVFDR